MLFSHQQLEDLTDLAIRAARAAGTIINSHRSEDIQFDHKGVGTSMASQVVTDTDRMAQAAIVEILEPSCSQYDLALLTEESVDDGNRQLKKAFWSIDPMDGTLAFIRKTAGFAVSIALVAKNGSPLIGVVYEPLSESVYYAADGAGAYRNEQRIQVPEPDSQCKLVLCTDFSFQTHPWLQQTKQGLAEIASTLGMNGFDIQFRIGAVMNAVTILEKPNCCYFKYPRTGDSGGSLWDYAATACLFNEAGAVASDLFGQPLDLNRPENTFMNHRGILYAASNSIAEQIVALHNTLQHSVNQH